MSYYSEEMKERIFDMTGGTCHLCGKNLVFKNYGDRYARGGWVVEHGQPRSRGGVDDLRNLRAACFECNEMKADRHSSTETREIIGQTGEGFLVCANCGSANLSVKFLGAQHTWGDEYFYRCKRCGHVGKGRGRLRPEER